MVFQPLACFHNLVNIYSLYNRFGISECRLVITFYAKICLTRDTICRIDIVSRCFENKNNNCCEFFFCKNAVGLLFTNPYLDTLQLGRPGIRVARSWICKVNNKKWHFCKVLFHNNYCFYFQNIWIQCRFDGLCLRSNISL